MSKKKDEKNPYVNNLSLEQVARAEELFYYVQIGDEVANSGRKFTFAKDVAESVFWQMYESLKDMKKLGNAKEKRDAHYCLHNIRIHKLRIH